MPRLPAGLALAVAFLTLAACAGLREPATAPAEPGAVAALDRYAPNQCNPAVAEALAGARIPIAQVEGVVYGLYRDLNRDRIVMYDAWVKLRGQPGSVVVQLDEYCFLRQVYTRGGAQLPDPVRG